MGVGGSLPSVSAVSSRHKQGYYDVSSVAPWSFHTHSPAIAFELQLLLLFLLLSLPFLSLSFLPCRMVITTALPSYSA